MALLEGAAEAAVKALNLGELEATALANLDAQSVVLATALDKILQARIGQIDQILQARVAQLVDDVNGVLVGRVLQINIGGLPIQITIK